jgi:hypothetical protein
MQGILKLTDIHGESILLGVNCIIHISNYYATKEVCRKIETTKYTYYVTETIEEIYEQYKNN